MTDIRRARQRTLGWFMVAGGLLAAFAFFNHASNLGGAADVEEMYCAETIFTTGDSCEMDSTNEMKTSRAVGGVSLAVAALGGVIVFLSPREGSTTASASTTKTGSAATADKPYGWARDRFRQLKELRDSGAITQGEYEEARRRVLDDF